MEELNMWSAKTKLVGSIIFMRREKSCMTCPKPATAAHVVVSVSPPCSRISVPMDSDENLLGNPVTGRTTGSVFRKKFCMTCPKPSTAAHGVVGTLPLRWRINYPSRPTEDRLRHPGLIEPVNLFAETRVRHVRNWLQQRKGLVSPRSAVRLAWQDQ